MIIPDIVFAVGNIILSLGLIPSIISKNKPSVYTSLITSIVMCSFTFSFLSLSLYISAGFTCLTTIGWIVLLLQKLMER